MKKLLRQKNILDADVGLQLFAEVEGGPVGLLQRDGVVAQLLLAVAADGLNPHRRGDLPLGLFRPASVLLEPVGLHPLSLLSVSF